MNVIDWLLDSDPALRWQVLRDLTDASAELQLRRWPGAGLHAQRRTEPDQRMDEALVILESKRGADGRWPLEHAYHDKLLVDLGETEGQPSRWITLRALRVLRVAKGKSRRELSGVANA
jgi:hypothetical protein